MSVYLSILKQWTTDPIQNHIILPILNLLTTDNIKKFLLLPIICYIGKQIKDHLLKSVFDHLHKYVFVPISYPFKCDSYVEKLEKQTEELKAKRDSLEQSVFEDEDVTKWLSSAKNEINGADTLIQGKEEAKMKKCLFGLFPNFKSRYQLSKEADKKASAIDKLWNQQGLVPFSSLPPLHQRADPSMYNREALPSRVLILNQVMDALKDPNLYMIGVYGLGGVGKTTLAKEVLGRAVEEKMFKRVVVVPVSQTPDLRKIQEQIADFVDLKFDAQGEARRAIQLKERLEKSKVLIILDDIWTKLELNDVGIPLGTEFKGSKLLLTSRRQDVLSREMATKKSFSLDVLGKEEGWSLFQMTLADANNPELVDIAIKVAEKCSGLPLLINIVAADLKNKELSAWEDTLVKLSDFGNEEIYRKVHKVLKTSYENLPSDEVAPLFLLCCLFGQSNIPTNHLLTYAMGLGLFKNIVRVKQARDRLCGMIEKLKTESFLLDGDMNGHVKMHDVVLDFARSIATKDQHAFFGITDNGLRQLWPADDNCTRIVLHHCDISVLPESPKYPKAELLSLFSEDLDLVIPDLFFKGISKLRVLNLTGMRLITLPSSLGFLTNLHSLYMHQCRLKDVAIIGDLKQLEFLSFENSDIVELSIQIGELTQLKSLNLTKCSYLRVIPPNVLPNLSLLEELYMDKSFDEWDLNGNASLMELEELRQLTTLEVQVSFPKKLPNQLFSKGLERYRIVIGDQYWDWNENYGTSRILKLTLKTSIHLEDGLKQLLRGSEDLSLGEVKGMENGLYDLNEDGFPKLKHLYMKDNKAIRHIDFTKWVSCDAFPILETLGFRTLNSLEEICHGRLGSGSFSKLRSLDVSDCVKLKKLFSFSAAKNLSQLQKMVVSNCNNLEAIIEEGSEDGICNPRKVSLETQTEMTLDLKELDSLEEICHGRLGTGSFSKLRTLNIWNCGKLKKLFSFSTAKNLSQLQEIRVSNCNNLEAIIAEGSEDGICNPRKVSFPNLTSLSVDGCKSLKYICKASTIKILLHLKRLEIRDCELVEEIIFTEEFEEYMNKIVFPDLNFLSLENLPRCIRFSNGYPVEFQSLREMKLQGCHVLKSLVSNISNTSDIVNNDIFDDIQFLFNEMVSFPNLTSLSVDGCKSLKYICKASTIKILLHLKRLEIRDCELVEEIIFTEEFEECMNKIVFPDLNFLSLENLPRCIRFSNGYPVEFQSLREIYLQRCHVLKNLVSNISSTSDIVNNDISDDIQFLFNKMVTFPNLQKMVISGMDILENIWHTQLPPDSFSNLQSLRIWRCPNLLTVFPSNVLLRFQRLENLYISSLSSLKSIWSDEDADGVFTFQINLKSLVAWDCKALEYVFPASIACGPLLQLKKLEIWSCGALKHIVGKGKSEEEPYSFHFPHLTILQLQYLYGLRSFYEGRHAFNGPKLEDLEIWNCPKLKVSSCQEPLLLFDTANPNLKTLKLDCKILKAMQISIEQCSILKEIELYYVRDRDDSDFLSGFLKRLYNLERLAITESTLQELFFLKDLCLQTLDIIYCPCLKSLTQSSISFQNLTTLHVGYCKELENLVTASTAKSMVRLVELRIEDCDMMKEIVANDGDHAEHHIIFNQLKILELSDLPALNSFCSENYTFNFPLLEKVIVNQCWQMKIFCGGVFAAPKLQGIRHEEYGKELYRQGNINATLASLSTEKDVLCDARKWHVIKDGTSRKVLLANQLQFLHNLSRIKVKDCDSIQVVFDLEEVSVEDGHAGLLPNLEDLKLINLPMLSQLWNKDPFGILDFRELQWLEMENCNILKYAFTASMASSLIALREIIVENCEMMEAIIKEEEAEERVEPVNKLILPLLESVHLKCLPKLSSLYSGNGILECPSLEKIYIKECPSMKEFVSSLSSIQSPTTDDRMVHQIAIPSLEEMRIEWELIKDKLEGNNQPDFLHILQVLQLTGVEGEFVAFPFDKSFPNIKEFVLSDSLVEKIITEEMNKDDPQMVSFFQNLEKLRVWECNRLEIVVPSSVSFKNLAYLKVSNCDGLINLVTASTAKSLVHLETMYVSECKMMREIVAIESDGKEDDQISFSRLETLVLVNLPCLTSFCSANYAFDFPYLNYVVIEDCPNMKMFAQQLLNTPQLTEVCVNYFGDRKWEGSLNNTVQAMFLERNEEETG